MTLDEARSESAALILLQTAWTLFSTLAPPVAFDFEQATGWAADWV